MDVIDKKDINRSEEVLPVFASFAKGELNVLVDEVGGSDIENLAVRMLRQIIVSYGLEKMRFP